MMESLNASPEAASKVAAVQKQVDDVKSVMVENIGKVGSLIGGGGVRGGCVRLGGGSGGDDGSGLLHALPCPLLLPSAPQMHNSNAHQILERGDKIQLLVDRTDDLQLQAQQFQKQVRFGAGCLMVLFRGVCAGGAWVLVFGVVHVGVGVVGSGCV